MHRIVAMFIVMFSIVFTPDATAIAAGTWNGTVRVWPGSTTLECPTLLGHVGSVNAVAVSLAAHRDDAQLAQAGGVDHRVRDVMVG